MIPHYRIVAEVKEVPTPDVEPVVKKKKKIVKDLGKKYHVVFVTDNGEVTVTPDVSWRHCIDYLSCVCGRPEYTGG